VARISPFTFCGRVTSHAAGAFWFLFFKSDMMIFLSSMQAAFGSLALRNLREMQIKMVGAGHGARVNTTHTKLAALQNPGP